MGTANGNVRRIFSALLAVAIVCACATAVFPALVDAGQSSADESSKFPDDEYRGSSSPRGLGFAARVHQLQLLAAARHAGGLSKLLPVDQNRKLIVDDKRDDAGMDVDYGWGGGRFGKRRNGDSLGLAGRFGRSVDTGYDSEDDDRE